MKASMYVCMYVGLCVYVSVYMYVYYITTAVDIYNVNIDQ